MGQDTIFQGEMDPELAALFETDGSGGVSAQSSNADFADIFNEDTDDEKNSEDSDVNLREKAFPAVTKRLETTPHNGFNDPNYYKIALSGEGDIAQRVHTILQKYINSKDPKDRSVFRQQFATAYWDFLSGVARKTAGTIPDPKKYLLRFGILHPTFLNANDREFFSKIVVNNELSVPVYYLDEWFKAVGIGEVRNSATDEIRIAKNSSQVKMQQLLDKAVGKRDGARGLLRAKEEERNNIEGFFKERVQTITEHFPIDGLPGITACYTEAQKRAFAELHESIKQLLKADRDMSVFLRDFFEAEEDVKTLQEKVEQSGGGAEVDVRAVDTEFETVRQMAKMTIGRQGNHFPLLTGEYFHCSPNDVGFRENVVSILTWIESVDPEAFCRSYKNRLNRIVPYVVLLPTYGDYGVCWEPFERINRATSRGRVALPMYPKNLLIASLSAVADLRWQVAKEKASYYWMEEGLTGNYYQWFTAKKLKGDLKEYFIQDYIIWMTKESEGTQKLEKEVRGMFWRYMPFSKSVKEKLRNRSYVYQELYQRDLNRAMSDGY
ncbi:MAG: hypothetical protein LBP74_10270 [Treponema sp.]|jgi:hypothetical protein|nr:hypothetical protein [Treponema sp.]